MQEGLTPNESMALYKLLAEQSLDVVVKCDPDGQVVHASPALRHWGMDIGPGVRLADLAHDDCRTILDTEFSEIVAGRGEGRVEFFVRDAQGGERWFELRLGRLEGGTGETGGTIGLIRSVQDRRMFEERLFEAEMTDPLTGVTNRRAFIAMLEHITDKGTGGCVAIFALDYFKGLNMRYGQSFGDEVLVTFAELLRNMVRSEDTISRIGSETLGVLLPGARADQAEAVCRRVIAAMAEIRQAAGPDSVAITASVGLSRIGKSLDATMKRAEMALFLAKAKGRNRLEVDSGRRLPRTSERDINRS